MENLPTNENVVKLPTPETIFKPGEGLTMLKRKLAQYDAIGNVTAIFSGMGMSIDDPFMENLAKEDVQLLVKTGIQCGNRDLEIREGAKNNLQEIIENLSTRDAQQEAA